MEKQLQELEAATQQAHLALNAKGRRLQLLQKKCTTNDSMDGNHNSDVTILKDRAIGLEALITELGSQLDEGEREVRQLRFKKENKEREDQEKDWLHMQLLQSQQQQLDALSAELNKVPNHSFESS